MWVVSSLFHSGVCLHTQLDIYVLVSIYLSVSLALSIHVFRLRTLAWASLATTCGDTTLLLFVFVV